MRKKGNTMKQSLLTLMAIAAVPSLAQAQANVTLSGILKTGIEQASISGAGNTGSMMAMTDGSSRFIISGSEDLGAGLRASFQIDTRFRPDEAKSASASLAAIADGATWVGLAGSFGQVRLGRMDQHYNHGADEHSIRATPLQHWNISLLSYINQSVIARGSRTDNLVRWDSPNISGFNLGFGYSTAAISSSGGGTYDGCPSAPSLTSPSPSCALGAAAKGDAIALNGGYSSGSVRGGISYWNAYNEPKTVKHNAIRVWGGFNFGIVDIGLTVDQSSLTAAGTTNGSQGAKTERLAWSVPVKAALGPGTLLFTYTVAQDSKTSGNTNANSGAKYMVIGYDYSLSKRTSLGASYAKLDNASGANYAPFTGASGANQPSLTAGQDLSSIYLGLRHTF